MTTPSQAFSRNAREARLLEALGKLPDEQRDALRLRYVENLPSKQIAERLGKTDAAVRVMLTRSLKKLHELLGDDVTRSAHANDRYVAVPELPDITSYLVALRPRIVGERLEKIQVRSPFLVRTVEPDVFSLEGETVLDLSRIGKRIVWHFADERFFVFHLMIAGRFHWKKAGREAGGQERSGGVRLCRRHADADRGEQEETGVAARRRRCGGARLNSTAAASSRWNARWQQFRDALTRENHTLKRALADPRLFSGIGNAYSDEILFAARLSPVTLTSRLG